MRPRRACTHKRDRRLRSIQDQELHHRQIRSNCTTRPANHSFYQSPCATSTKNRGANDPDCDSQEHQAHLSRDMEQLNCSPMLSYPTGLGSVDSQWATCKSTQVGRAWAILYDPPRTPAPGSNLVPVQTKSPSPTSSAAPADVPVDPGPTRTTSQVQPQQSRGIRPEDGPAAVPARVITSSTALLPDTPSHIDASSQANPPKEIQFPDTLNPTPEAKPPTADPPTIPAQSGENLDSAIPAPQQSAEPKNQPSESDTPNNPDNPIQSVAQCCTSRSAIYHYHSRSPD